VFFPSHCDPAAAQGKGKKEAMDQPQIHCFARGEKEGKKGADYWQHTDRDRYGAGETKLFFAERGKKKEKSTGS